MTRLFTCGFETGYIEWNGATNFSASNFVSTIRRTGTYSGLLAMGQLPGAGSSISYFRQVFDANQTHLFGRFALRISSTASTYHMRIVDFRDSQNGNQFSIVYDGATQSLYWRSGYTTAGALLGTPGYIVVPADTWIVVEFETVIGSSGSLTLKINGSTDAIYSGDTDLTNDGVVRSMYFWAFEIDGYNGVFGASNYVDDIGINNADGSYENSWPGLGGVFYLEPTADGDQTDWTPSAGTVNYAMVDDIPPDNATTFNQGYASNEIDLYEVDDCPQYINVINLVEVVYRAALVTSGYNELTDLVKVGGTVYSGVEWTIVPITPSFTYYKGTTHYINPNTGSAWGTAEVNATQAGIEVTT